MITLAVLDQMEKDAVGNLTVDKDLFWEEAPLQKDGKPAQGVWLVTRAGNAANNPKGLNLRSTVDFYVAFKNKVTTEAVQQAILEWILANRYFCKLRGNVGGTTYSYSNVRIRPATTPENYGATDNGLIVKIASADIIYDLADDTNLKR